MSLVDLISKIDVPDDPFDGSDYRPLAVTRSPIRRNGLVSEILSKALTSTGHTVEKIKGVGQIRVDGDPCIVRASITDSTIAQWSSIYPDADWKFAYLVYINPHEEFVFRVPREKLLKEVQYGVGRTDNVIVHVSVPPTPVDWIYEHEVEV